MLGARPLRRRRERKRRGRRPMPDLWRTRRSSPRWRATSPTLEVPERSAQTLPRGRRTRAYRTRVGNVRTSPRRDDRALPVDRPRGSRCRHRNDPKGRFERERASGGEGRNENENGRENERIRAAYGHSVDVALGDSEDETARSIPDRLYHGTAPRNRDAIAGEGLVPMGRREVHLSGSLEAAREVGARHAADPIVFAVDAHELIESGHRVTKRGRGIYATDRVPPEFLAECDRDA